MYSMKKYIIVLVGFAALISGFFWFKNVSTKASAAVRIGIILPLSGEYGALGENVVKGAQLAMGEYLQGHASEKVELIAEDDQLDTKKGLSAYKKLIDLEGINALISASAPTFGVIYDDAKIRNLPVVAVNTETRDETNDNVFSIRPSADSSSKGLGAYVKAHLTGKIVAVRTNDALVIKLAKYFAEGYGSEIETFSTNRDNNDYSTIATKILSENPRVIIVSTYATDGSLIVRELLKQSRAKKARPQFVFDSLFNENISVYQKVLGDLAVLDGSLVISIKNATSNIFTQAYKIKYGQEPGPLADLGYDAVRTLLGAHDTDSGQWIKNINNIKDEKGAAGVIIFDSVGSRNADFKVTTFVEGKIPAF